MEFTGVKEGTVQYLRLQIITGELSPGQRLNEIELANKINISRAPLREAFRLLENEHLVVSISRKGCYVCELSLEDCEQIFQAREMIECFAVDLLKDRGSIDLSLLGEDLEKTAKLEIPAAPDPLAKYEYCRDILNFHIKLVESSGNLRLVQFFQSIFSSLARYRLTYEPAVGLAIKSHRDHEEIYELIKDKRYEQAKDNLRSHIQWALSKIISEID